MRTWILRVYKQGSPNNFEDHTFQDTEIGTTEKYNQMVAKYVYTNFNDTYDVQPAEDPHFYYDNK